MNRFHRGTAALATIVLLAACAPAPDASGPSPVHTPHDLSAESDLPVASSSARPSADPSATGTPVASAHEMGHSGGDAGTEAVTVDIANFSFEPATLTISVGTRVTFINSDAAPHTATAGTDEQPMPDLFDSGLLATGESYSFVFDEPGVYDYYCERHPPMVGRIVVEG